MHERHRHRNPCPNGPCCQAIQLETVLVHRFRTHEEDRIINVSMLNNGQIVWYWSNGERIPEHIVRKYTKQINNAKTTLEAKVRDRTQAHGLPLIYNYYNDGTRIGIYSFPETRSENREDVQYSYPDKMVPQRPEKLDHRSTLPKPVHVI